MFTLMPFAAAAFSTALALASVTRKRTSPAAWFFFAGMIILASDALFSGLVMRSTDRDATAFWLIRAFAVKSFAPVVWLGFSLSYSRGDYRRFLKPWGVPLAIAALLPIVVLSTHIDQLLQVRSVDDGHSWALQFGPVAQVVNGLSLLGLVLALMNLEQTFRAAVGTMRWRIKFVIVGLALIFGAHIYVRSQAILFTAHDMSLSSLEAGALIVGCLFLAAAYFRTGMAEIDVYPSLAVLRSSLTVLIVGGYLLVVGVLAQLVRRFGGAELFQFQVFIVLVGMAGLAVILLSDRLRQRVRGIASRHFGKAQHDSVRIWGIFSQRLAAVRDPDGLSTTAARLISETFDVLSVSVWVLNDERRQLVLGASTAASLVGPTPDSKLSTASAAVSDALTARRLPFDIEQVNEGWADELRRLNSTAFTHGGHRWCVPLRSDGGLVGAVVLADRVNGEGYSAEELELLQCIGDQMASILLNLRLTAEVVRAKELEAFRTMSAFFVHDLKNAAASLNLMLKNLPVHFDDPAFRADALRGIGNTATRIDNMIARLGALRQTARLTPIETDLNELVTQALERFADASTVELETDLHPLPQILADREQIHSVLANLLLNAREAVDGRGRIGVRTELQGENLVLSVTDNGCGMNPAFVNESLFRPFQSTKKKGLGIGLFQSRTIVQAHGGSVHVESVEGKGTTFQLIFPLSRAHQR